VFSTPRLFFYIIFICNHFSEHKEIRALLGKKIRLSCVFLPAPEREGSYAGPVRVIACGHCFLLSNRRSFSARLQSIYNVYVYVAWKKKQLRKFF